MFPTSTIINKTFYNRETRKVAQDLLGKLLFRKYRGKLYQGIITETEAYCGPKDLASHASRGRTPRTEVMFGPAGRIYVYLIYGMYYCLNIVTEKEDYPAAVLIRAVVPVGTKNGQWLPLPEGESPPLTTPPKAEGGLRGRWGWETNGPGKLCRYFHIDKSLNNLLLKKPYLWIEDRGIKPVKIKKLPRVGVDYAGEYKDKKRRYLGIFKQF